MTKIYLNIEAESVAELMETVGQFVSNPAPVLQKAVDEVAEKKSQKKTTKAKKEKAEEKAASMEKTSEEKVSSTAKQETKLKEDKEPEKSTTEGQYPDATKADVQAAMKKAMDGGHRPEVKTAFGRFNAGKLSDLKEEDYSAFITDLEALIATAGD